MSLAGRRRVVRSARTELVPLQAILQRSRTEIWNLELRAQLPGSRLFSLLLVDHQSFHCARLFIFFLSTLFSMFASILYSSLSMPYYASLHHTFHPGKRGFDTVALGLFWRSDGFFRCSISLWLCSFFSPVLFPFFVDVTNLTMSISRKHYPRLL